MQQPNTNLLQPPNGSNRQSVTHDPRNFELPGDTSDEITRAQNGGDAEQEVFVIHPDDQNPSDAQSSEGIDPTQAAL